MLVVQQFQRRNYAAHEDFAVLNIVPPRRVGGRRRAGHMVTLKPGNDIREMFLKVPFALDFKVYLFNVTNPMEVQMGKLPSVHEVGPFCYE
ncbi:hypothetical protein NQ318_020774 [Aromia moschata]|uniref:Uncharacterized protein n=1 Tax=Aromia moschata TaxID=1265417 RepID=A0AAV8YCY9_9CUCU|nr:hypothetical protein NQ318_020774 [Aromia moschata]